MPATRRACGRREAGEKSLRQPPADAWFVYVLRCADGTLYTGLHCPVNHPHTATA